jgi:ParB family chromosome partitioning protein
MGHARGLIGMDDPNEQLQLFYKILNEGLNVRQVEEAAKSNSDKKVSKDKKGRSSQALSFELQKIKEDLGRTLESRISIKKFENGTGELVITFNSDNDLNRIYSLIEP